MSHSKTLKRVKAPAICKMVNFLGLTQKLPMSGDEGHEVRSER